MKIKGIEGYFGNRISFSAFDKAMKYIAKKKNRKGYKSSKDIIRAKSSFSL